jgi:hypothetical protein
MFPANHGVLCLLARSSHKTTWKIHRRSVQKLASVASITTIALQRKSRLWIGTTETDCKQSNTCVFDQRFCSHMHKFVITSKVLTLSAVLQCLSTTTPRLLCSLDRVAVATCNGSFTRNARSLQGTFLGRATVFSKAVTGHRTYRLPSTIKLALFNRCPVSRWHLDKGKRTDHLFTIREPI